MSIAVIAALSAVYIVFGVARFFVTSAKWAKIDFVVSCVGGAAGIAGYIVSVILFLSKISSLNAEFPGESYGDWAKDVLSGYLKDTLPALLIVLAVLILSFFIQPKMYVMRALVTPLASVMILIYGKITEYLSENGNVTVTIYISLLSVSASLILFGTGLFDFRALFKKLKG